MVLLINSRSSHDCGKKAIFIAIITSYISLPSQNHIGDDVKKLLAYTRQLEEKIRLLTEENKSLEEGMADCRKIKLVSVCHCVFNQSALAQIATSSTCLWYHPK